MSKIFVVRMFFFVGLGVVIGGIIAKLIGYGSAEITAILSAIGAALIIVGGVQIAEIIRQGTNRYDDYH